MFASMQAQRKRGLVRAVQASWRRPDDEAKMERRLRDPVFRRLTPVSHRRDTAGLTLCPLC